MRLTEKRMNLGSFWRNGSYQYHQVVLLIHIINEKSRHWSAFCCIFFFRNKRKSFCKESGSIHLRQTGVHNGRPVGAFLKIDLFGIRTSVRSNLRMLSWSIVWFGCTILALWRVHRLSRHRRKGSRAGISLCGSEIWIDCVGTRWVLCEKSCATFLYMMKEQFCAH